MIQDVLDEQNRSRPRHKMKKTVTAKDLKACWAKVGLPDPDERGRRKYNYMISKQAATIPKVG